MKKTVKIIKAQRIRRFLHIYRREKKTPMDHKMETRRRHEDREAKAKMERSNNEFGTYEN